MVLVAIVIRRLGAGQVPGPLEPLAGDADDQAGPGRGPPQGLRARHAAAAAPGLPAQVGRGVEPAPRGRRRRRRADLQHALQPLAGRRPVPRRPGRAGLGRLAAACSARSAWCRACTTPTCSGTAGIRPLFRDVRKQRQEIDARRPRCSAACGSSGPSAASRASRRGSWARTTSWPGWSFTSGGWSRLIELLWDFILPDGLGRPAALRRPAGPRRPALARRPDDVPGLPGDAPGADGRAGHERHPVPEQPRRASTACSTSWPSRARWPTAPARVRVSQGRRSPGGSRFEDVGFVYPGHRAGRCSATSTWRSSPARRSPWSAGAARARRRSAT